MKPDRPTSLKDIADACGVSFPLVSKVLRGNMGNTRARPEVIEAIQKKARELDYRPNLLADALRRGRTGAVGVIVHPTGAPGTERAANLLHGISAGLEQHRFRLWLRFYMTDDEFIGLLDKRARHEMDGLIVVGMPHKGTFDRLRELHDAGLPMISIFETLSIPGVPNVSADISRQGCLATEHLLSLGCRRIGHMITAIPYPLPPHVKIRHHGYQAAHAARGIETDPALMVPVPDYGPGSGRLAVRHWLDNNISFDGIAAQSDNQAIGAIHELLRNGIRVPEQVRIVGVDDSPACLLSPVALSSVTAESISVGRFAADMIATQIDGHPVPSTQIPPRLIIRHSSNPAAPETD